MGTQDGQIAAFAAVAGKKMAVVVVTPGAILTPWRDSVAAVLNPDDARAAVRRRHRVRAVRCAGEGGSGHWRSV